MTFPHAPLIGCALLGAALAATAEANPYAPFHGDSIRIMVPDHPHYHVARDLLPLFTQETGIAVEVEMLPYLPMREKQARALAEADGAYDLIAYVVFSKADYVAADQLWPLARFMMDPLLVDPAYAPQDIVPGYLENIGVVGGRMGYLSGPLDGVYGVPFGAETSVLAYRKDIFERHGLTPPQDYDALLQLACEIEALEPGMTGLTTRSAAGHQASHAFLLHLAPLGGRIFDDAWRFRANDAAGVAAAQALKTIVDCGPEGGENFSFAQMQAAFIDGDAAMYLDSISIAGAAKAAGVEDLIGYAPHPAGVRRASQTGGFGLGVPRNAFNPEAGFLLLQWLTSPRIDRMIAERGGAPMRVSTYANPDLNAALPHLRVFGEALRDADPNWRPIIRVWGRINDMLGQTLARIIAGEITAQAGLDSLVEPVEALMEQEGYYAWTQNNG